MLKGGSAWMPGNQINGVNSVLPFRFSGGAWQLGARGPISLRIAEVMNQVTVEDITADLQGACPWSENNPLLLSDVSADLLGGKVIMQQLWIPQHDLVLLWVQNTSSSGLISVVNLKQSAISGSVSDALPLWLDNEKWIIKDGWLTNPGPMTLRIDRDTADAVVRDNMATGAATNWLRYMEISHSWMKVNLGNLDVLTMQSAVTGNSRVDGKVGTVNLDYTYEENVFTLWHSLHFGDNLQVWSEQNAALPETHCPEGKECEEQQRRR